MCGSYHCESDILLEVSVLEEILCNALVRRDFAIEITISLGRLKFTCNILSPKKDKTATFLGVKVAQNSFQH